MRALLQRIHWSPWPAALAFGALHAIASIVLVWASPETFVDGEALHNATVARELLTGSGGFLLEFQYRPNCGGCTLVSLLGAGLFRLFGVTFLAWKLVPITFGAAVVTLGCVLAERVAGRFASVAFALLVLGAPVFVQHLMQMAWGTHFEVMAFVLAQAVLASYAIKERRGDTLRSDGVMLGWGLAAGFGLWFCYTSAFAFPTLWAVVLIAGTRTHLRRRLALSFAGVAVGASPLAVFALATDRSPFAITTQSLVTTEAASPLAKLAEVTLFRFAQELYNVHIDLIFPRYAVVALALLWTAALGAGIAAVVRERHERPAALLPVALLLVATVAYVVTDFRVDPFDRDRPLPTIALRYLFPASILLLLTAAQGLGTLKNLGLGGTVAAVALTLTVAVPGLYCRAKHSQPRDTGDCRVTAGDLRPYDYAWFQTNRLGEVEESKLLAHPPSDWLSRVNHRRTVGARRADWLLSGLPKDMPVLLDELRGLPGVEPRDVPALLHGLALALPSAESLSPAQRSRLQMNVVALMHATNPDERSAIANGAWVRGSRLAQPMDWPLPGTATEADERLGWEISGADCAICPAIGAAHTPARDVDSLTSLRDFFPEGERGLPDERGLRLAVIEGRAATYGRRYGYCTEPFEALAADLDGDEGAALLRGFELGKVLQWRVDIAPDTPVARVP